MFFVFNESIEYSCISGTWSKVIFALRFQCAFEKRIKNDNSLNQDLMVYGYSSFFSAFYLYVNVKINFPLVTYLQKAKNVLEKIQ